MNVAYQSLPSISILSSYSKISPTLSTLSTSSSIACECNLGNNSHEGKLPTNLPINAVRLPSLSRLLTNFQKIPTHPSSVQPLELLSYVSTFNEKPYPIYVNPPRLPRIAENRRLCKSLKEQLIPDHSLPRILNMDKPLQLVNGDDEGSSRQRICGRKKCSRLCKVNSLYCKWHVDSRICRMQGCEKSSKAGGYCISHGGGRRCRYPGGCGKSAKNGNLCIAHGGGIRCSVPNCTKAAILRRLCSSHGGGRRQLIYNHQDQPLAPYL